jgi:hypothetical protein
MLLCRWGQRVWTFPEILLAPAGKDIKVYTRGSNLMQPVIVAKNQFAAKVWKEDAHVARQVCFVIHTSSALTNSDSLSIIMKVTSF